jgi:hypothetical protein
MKTNLKNHLMDSSSNMTYYYEPYKTRVRGFNTEFSRNDLKVKMRRGEELLPCEQVFVDHLRSQNLWD